MGLNKGNDFCAISLCVCRAARVYGSWRMELYILSHSFHFGLGGKEKKLRSAFLGNIHYNGLLSACWFTFGEFFDWRYSWLADGTHANKRADPDLVCQGIMQLGMQIKLTSMCGTNSVYWVRSHHFFYYSLIHSGLGLELQNSRLVVYHISLRAELEDLAKL